MPANIITSGIYTFYSTAEYFAQLCEDIDQAMENSRILLATMAFYPEIPEIDSLTAALCKAAARGVHVTLNIDAYNFLELGNGAPLAFHRQLPDPLPSTLSHLDDALRALQKAGVTVVVTNMPRQRLSLPVAGRSHAKISIINDKIYLGGCNLAEQHLDCMVAWTDQAAADWLYNLFTQRTATPHTLRALGTRDIHQSISSQEDIIFDVGVKGQSAIFEEALALIDRAEKWLFITCQYFPNSITAKHLRHAHRRGVTVIPVFNHYLQHGGTHKLLQAAVTLSEQLRMPASFFAHQLQPKQTFLHAKVLASEQEAIIGSHNYVRAGVLLGTAEIAIHSTNPTFGSAAALTIARQVNSPVLTQALVDHGIIDSP